MKEICRRRDRGQHSLDPSSATTPLRLSSCPMLKAMSFRGTKRLCVESSLCVLVCSSSSVRFMPSVLQGRHLPNTCTHCATRHLHPQTYLYTIRKHVPRATPFACCSCSSCSLDDQLFLPSAVPLPSQPCISANTCQASACLYVSRQLSNVVQFNFCQHFPLLPPSSEAVRPSLRRDRFLYQHLV